MSSYLGKFADYYDLIYAKKNYAEEADFLNECINKFGNGNTKAHLLELACGSGRHAFELEKLGYKILASDYSEDLLTIALREGKQAKSKVEFVFTDMREIDFPENKFDAVLCLFDSIGFVQSDIALKKVFSGVRNHLHVGGLFIFEFWHSAAMLKHYESQRVGKWQIPGGTLMRISQTELLLGQNLAKVDYELIELMDNQTFSISEESQVNRFFHIPEMRKFVEEAAFEAQVWLNGYTWDETINEAVWHVLCVAKAL